jgi:serine/threonine-protein kinase
MAAEIKKEIGLEIAHVLFIDIVGYSKLSVNEQHARIGELNEVVRLSEQFRTAEAASRLLKIPTGDGMALVFYKSPEEPAQCAVEISRALKDNPRLQVRMGIHSGPISGVVDVNERTNVAGGGINMAQRVMDCGDAGHILLSHHVAEDLEQFDRWRPFLHDIGAFDAKHGVLVSVTNLYSDEVGNPQLPSKLQAVSKHRARVRWAGMTIVLLTLAVIVAAFFFLLRRPMRSVSGIVEKSIAVLPFENLSEDKANAYFADGVQDEILTDLARVADLKVISRTSVLQYRNAAARNLREIAQQLGVAHVLEGSVQRAANKIRVNAQLIDARNDAHLWGQTYDRDLADVFAIQSEIAKTIAEQLQAKLSPKEEAVVEAKPTKDIVAYDLYLRASEIARNRSTTIGTGGAEGAKQGVQLLDQAVTRDPDFVNALCRLAEVHLYLFYLNDRSAPHVDLAKKALEAAARLQPDAGEVHLTRGLLYYRGSLDYGPALAEFALARRSLPNDADVPFFIGMIERRQGHWDESIRHVEQAVALDPHNVIYISELAVTYLRLRRYDEAAKTLDSALKWKPLDFGMALLRAFTDKNWKADLGRWRAVVAGAAGRPADPNDLISARLMLALLERNYYAAQEALETPGLAEFDDNGFFTPREWNEGIIARGLGDNARANAALLAARQRAAAAAQESPNDARALIVLGQIDAALGRTADAVREGERAVELLPPSKDALNGGFVLERLARIYAQTGDSSRAVSFLENAAKFPDGPPYGSLKLDQDWDALRGDPRFEKIVASQAPKQ